MSFNSQVIIACDFDSKVELNSFLDKLAGEKLFLKLGMQILYAEGFALIKELREKGHNIFVDLKIHDIPSTSSKAVKSLLKYQPDIITIHISGGTKMLEDCVAITQNSLTNLAGVTILTSLNQTDLEKLNINTTIDQQVAKMMILASKAGLKYVICSPLEAKLANHVGLQAITPGIRLANNSVHDQSRFATPQEAIKNGASLIVIGRSITESQDPQQTYHQILKELIWK